MAPYLHLQPLPDSAISLREDSFPGDDEDGFELSTFDTIARTKIPCYLAEQGRVGTVPSFTRIIVEGDNTNPRISVYVVYENEEELTTSAESGCGPLSTYGSTHSLLAQPPSTLARRDSTTSTTSDRIHTPTDNNLALNNARYPWTIPEFKSTALSSKHTNETRIMTLPRPVTYQGPGGGAQHDEGTNSKWSGDSVLRFSGIFAPVRFPPQYEHGPFDELYQKMEYQGKILVEFLDMRRRTMKKAGIASPVNSEKDVSFAIAQRLKGMVNLFYSFGRTITAGIDELEKLAAQFGEDYMENFVNSYEFGLIFLYKLDYAMKSLILPSPAAVYPGLAALKAYHASIEGVLVEFDVLANNSEFSGVYALLKSMNETLDQMDVTSAVYDELYTNCTRERKELIKRCQDRILLEVIYEQDRLKAKVFYKKIEKVLKKIRKLQFDPPEKYLIAVDEHMRKRHNTAVEEFYINILEPVQKIRRMLDEAFFYLKQFDILKFYLEPFFMELLDLVKGNDEHPLCTLTRASFVGDRIRNNKKYGENKRWADNPTWDKHKVEAVEEWEDVMVMITSMSARVRGEWKFLDKRFAKLNSEEASAEANTTPPPPLVVAENEEKKKTGFEKLERFKIKAKNLLKKRNSKNDESIVIEFTLDLACYDVYMSDVRKDLISWQLPISRLNPALSVWATGLKNNPAYEETIENSSTREIIGFDVQQKGPVFYNSDDDNGGEGNSKNIRPTQSKTLPKERHGHIKDNKQVQGPTKAQTDEPKSSPKEEYSIQPAPRKDIGLGIKHLDQTVEDPAPFHDDIPEDQDSDLDDEDEVERNRLVNLARFEAMVQSIDDSEDRAQTIMQGDFTRARRNGGARWFEENDKMSTQEEGSLQAPAQESPRSASSLDAIAEEPILEAEEGDLEGDETIRPQAPDVNARKRFSNASSGHTLSPDEVARAPWATGFADRYYPTQKWEQRASFATDLDAFDEAMEDEAEKDRLKRQLVEDEDGYDTDVYKDYESADFRSTKASSTLTHETHEAVTPRPDTAHEFPSRQMNLQPSMSSYYTAISTPPRRIRMDLDSASGFYAFPSASKSETGTTGFKKAGHGKYEASPAHVHLRDGAGTSMSA